ncbi:MAG TPA: cbb3-type cytochrome oxidase assembly protein CcoS [Candidatus Binatia bacterium]|jgi:cbb3-type cytochrome oxidase maturation protein
MTILFVLVPLGLMLLSVAIAAFFWAVRNGQFDDLESQGTFVLFDEEPLHQTARNSAGDGAASVPEAKTR